MKVLLFGDGPALKEKGKALREQNGWTVHLRTAARWAGEVETVDAVYFLAPADAIRAAYRARGIDCFLVEETSEDAAEDEDAADGDTDGGTTPPDDEDDPAESGGDGEVPGEPPRPEPAVITDTPPPEETGARKDGEGAQTATTKPETPAKTPTVKPTARPTAKSAKAKPSGKTTKRGR